MAVGLAEMAKPNLASGHRWACSLVVVISPATATAFPGSVVGPWSVFNVVRSILVGANHIEIRCPRSVG